MIRYSSLLPDEKIVSSLREDAPRAAQQGLLTQKQLDIIHQHHWFTLFVPKEYGGLDLSLPDAVRLEEELARIDGNIGWVVTLCGGASLFIGFLHEQARTEIFTRERLCIAGSGQSSGRARRIGTGYLLDGSWPYATGAPYADYFTANAIVEDSGELRSFIFPKEDAQIENTWNFPGMHATGTYSFSVRNIHVPPERCFVISPSSATLPHAIYRFPFLQLAEATLAVNIAGMCTHFFELAAEHLAARDNRGNDLLEKFQHERLQKRKRFYEILDMSWSDHEKNILVPENLQRVSASSKELAYDSRQYVNELFPWCGLSAARNDHPLCYEWRNINTAGQHSLLLT